jgi:UDPglucose 6-dehydrogenase
MTKHAINALLATSISFMNELATLCELAGADAVQVGQALRLDKRFGQGRRI